MGFKGGSVVKNPPANAGDAEDSGSIPGLERSLEGVHGNPLQYSYWDNLTDRGAWRATVHGVTESDMTEAHMHTHTHTHSHTHTLSQCR